MKKIESVLVKYLIFEDELGARVKLTVPRGGIPLQEGGILRSLSLGAISTTAMINDFKKARLKAAELKESGVQGVSEIVHGSTQEKLTPLDPLDPAAQAQAALANTEAPPVFVADGEETRYCTCTSSMGTRRCLNCGLMINNGNLTSKPS